ncbi:HyaD/HybD family hydrogenase maturation endopeptidase [Heliorestis acidaminivorans]|uniref:HyaD/HybD family hydrogenase maturation endopeptidase n=1 Tax=Heliorestis acidaminivorans TaxID=553427 RepID=A0A6I0F0E8_9FIRM|nr:HyaD/HybD family hydrogenase maturation endopeptidase [Heliorestis acidaminivorans]KAB2951775.1 HyaD/HybD family hydrogenase maturation endopeptidase [Heliorestis acidaminivorans]
MKKIVLMGLGNLLYSDEGLGVQIVQALQREYFFPDNVEVVDGGTQGLLLLEYLEEADYFLCVDAINAGKPAGTLIRLVGNEIPQYVGIKMSQHQLSFQEVLALASLRGTLPQEMVFLGIQPKSLEFGLDLSATVQLSLPALREAIVKQLAQWDAQPFKIE